MNNMKLITKIKYLQYQVVPSKTRDRSSDEGETVQNQKKKERKKEKVWRCNLECS